MDIDDIQIQSYPVGHLPLVRAIMDRLAIGDIIDHHLPKHALGRISDSQCVQAMLLNILSGRVALYRMDEWLQSADTELLFGEGAEPSAFNDTRLATALDNIDDIGTDNILFDVVRRHLEDPDRPTTYTVHMDTSSVSFYGAYEGHTEPFEVTYGYSKAKRPDLKQLILGLSLHGAVGIPLVATIMSGNTSDATANRDHLARLAKVLPSTDDITIVADCKLVDKDTLGRVLGAGFHFVSLVPDTFNVRADLIERAWDAASDVATWPELERRPGRLLADPPKVYRGFSYVEPFDVHLRPDADPTREATPSREDMRFVVVYSSTRAAKFEASLEKKLAKDRKVVVRFNETRGQTGFDCEADAQTEAARVVKRLKLQTGDIVVQSEIITLKRPRRGRPPAGEKAPTKVLWKVRVEVSRDEEAIKRARRKGSCFVLISDEMESDKTDVEVLQAYRHQQLVENHTGFRWFKSVAQVSPMFLKTPRRIRAIGLVMVLALMVRNYIQFTMRTALRENNEKLPHPFTKKQVNNLTTEMALHWFSDLIVHHVTRKDGSTTRHLTPLPGPAIRIAHLLRVDVQTFSRPPPTSRLNTS